MRNFSLLFLAVFITVSCNKSNKKVVVNSDTLFNKSISLPQNLRRLNGQHFEPINSITAQIDKKKKIYSIIDGTCMTCIVGQLNKIDSIFNSIILDSDNVMIFILNVNKSDSTFFMRNLQPYIAAKGIVLWDDCYSFEISNKLLTPDANLRTFMVDSSDKIIQYGNPLMHPDVIYQYRVLLETN